MAEKTRCIRITVYDGADWWEWWCKARDFIDESLPTETKEGVFGDLGVDGFEVTVE